jgi:hypothetical protein
MQRKIILHLSDPTHRIGAIKFIDLDALKMVSNIGLVQGGRTRRVVQQLVDSRLEGVKLVHEVGFHDIKFFLDLGLELCKVIIGRDNLKCHVIYGIL